VTEANKATVILLNRTGGPLDVASGALKVTVFQT